MPRSFSYLSSPWQVCAASAPQLPLGDAVLRSILLDRVGCAKDVRAHCTSSRHIQVHTSSSLHSPSCGRRAIAALNLSRSPGKPSILFKWPRPSASVRGRPCCRRQHGGHTSFHVTAPLVVAECITHPDAVGHAKALLCSYPAGIRAAECELVPPKHQDTRPVLLNTSPESLARYLSWPAATRVGELSASSCFHPTAQAHFNIARDGWLDLHGQ